MEKSGDRIFDGEQAINNEIAELIKKEDLYGAGEKLMSFLRSTYGGKMKYEDDVRDFTIIDVMSLRYFYKVCISPQEEYHNATDKNVIALLKLYDKMYDNSKGHTLWIKKWEQAKYESPYFKEGLLKELDDLYEDFEKYKNNGGKAPSFFVEFIRNSLEDAKSCSKDFK